MKSDILQNLLVCMENLENSLDGDEWFYVHDDLLSLRDAYDELNKTDIIFYKFKYKELIPQIILLEADSREFLKKFNIIC